MEPDFDQIYRLLGASPDQGWDAVRRAYRRRAQALHPDKVSGDVRLLKRARDRFEQLNSGYRELRRYRRIFGGLPPAGIVRDAHLDPRHPAPIVSPPAPRGNNRRRVWLAMLLLAAAPACWYLVEMAFQALRGAGADATAQLGPPTVPSPRIAFGTSLGEVLDIQGQPDRIEGDVWYYGESTIVFKDGRVASWQVAEGRRLWTVSERPESRPGVPPPVLEHFFDVGSSKARVLSVQGEPLQAGDQEWDYGVSKVYFENDQVVGWFNSPVDPLRVHGPFGRR